MQEALKNIICPACNSSGVGEEEKRHNLQRLRMENAQLKEEVIVKYQFMKKKNILYLKNVVTPRG